MQEESIAIYFPGRASTFTSIGMPAIQIFPIKEQFPTFLLFLSREGIGYLCLEQQGVYHTGNYQIPLLHTLRQLFTESFFQ
jgi:hypothetical protein